MNMTNSFFVVSFSLLVVACDSTDPVASTGEILDASTASTSSSSGGTGGSSSASSSSSNTGGAPSCAYGATYCSGSVCTCQIAPPSSNCITAIQDGTPSDGCDDGNPCTQDVIENGVCKHLFLGLGSSCSADNTMQCMAGGTGNQCCPIDPHPFCAQEGVQDICATGSVCMEGKCWVTCVLADDCAGPGSPGPSCIPLTVGHVSVTICGH